jgi:hypothetical protein
MFSLQNFEVTYRKFKVAGIYIRGNHAQKLTTKIIIIHFYFLLASSHRLKHMKENMHHKFFPKPSWKHDEN